MRIKKHPTGNQYLMTESGVWVRNFTTTIAPLDINNLSSPSDLSKFLHNETENDRNDISPLDLSSIKIDRAVIISDGYNFKEKQELLKDLKPNVAVIATNRTLVKWKVDRKIDFFLVNNPYPECMNFMPTHRYYPKCIASTRTYPEFIKTYKERGGMVANYLPAPEPKYSSPSRVVNKLDEYRNPICASINLAYKLGVTRLLLLCCDDSFNTERPAAVKLENGLWTYPQHLMSQRIIEGMLFWYRKQKGIKIADHSSGSVYDEVPYIPEEEISKFFE